MLGSVELMITAMIPRRLRRDDDVLGLKLIVDASAFISKSFMQRQTINLFCGRWIWAHAVKVKFEASS